MPSCNFYNLHACLVITRHRKGGVGKFITSQPRHCHYCDNHVFVHLSLFAFVINCNICSWYYFTRHYIALCSLRTDEWVPNSLNRHILIPLYILYSADNMDLDMIWKKYFEIIIFDQKLLFCRKVGNSSAG